MYGSQLYYKPEDIGWRILGEVGFDENYEFNLSVVWVDDEGQLRYSEDSGCSCYAPFEDRKPEEVEVIPSLEWLKGQLEAHDERARNYRYDADASKLAIVALLEKAHAHGLR